MSRLDLKNVPDDVVKEIEVGATERNMSRSEYSVRLLKLALRFENEKQVLSPYQYVLNQQNMLLNKLTNGNKKIVDKLDDLQVQFDMFFDENG
ncbi:hypothetical protein EQG49_13280 [Periweissella cryptocerci]|uniref:Ribbon-helix-helix protein, CopG family n=1 Tax=Periweissella cryptocerci TaxID=2506420 RepID=A0A4P6YWT5_9LACO|nr:hypothetical protein [Periweissella cryptocerci]QBO37369.1 hypothetical protein EQG49_13280 [Periweissella cryptocerci]